MLIFNIALYFYNWNNPDIFNYVFADLTTERMWLIVCLMKLLVYLSLERRNDYQIKRQDKEPFDTEHNNAHLVYLSAIEFLYI
jgi:hypothetical protein